MATRLIAMGYRFVGSQQRRPGADGRRAHGADGRARVDSPSHERRRHHRRVVAVSGARWRFVRARAGYDVVAIGRNQAALASLAEQAGTEYGRLVTAAIDIADPANAPRVVALAKEHFGRLDVLINNAGARRRRAVGRTIRRRAARAVRHARDRSGRAGARSAPVAALGARSGVSGRQRRGARAGAWAGRVFALEGRRPFRGDDPAARTQARWGSPSPTSIPAPSTPPS